MPTFAPSSNTMALGLLASLGACLVVGFLLQRTRSRLLAWSWSVATVWLAAWCTRDEGHGLRMLVIVAVTLYGMKGIVGVEHRRCGNASLRFRDWLAFAAVWLGMRPAEFRRRLALPLDRQLLVRVGLWFACGAVIVVLAREVHSHIADTWPHLAVYLFLVGCSMIMHFGMIGLVVAGLRWSGYPVGPQFRAPWLADSLQNFWTRRWNIGFSVMTAMAIQRPLAPLLGARGATFAGFVASGLLHELAISVPVGGGYGLPTIYFALHGVAMSFEQDLARRGTPLAGIAGRVWALCWVLLPAPLLFHEPFLEGVFVPLLRP